MNQQKKPLRALSAFAVQQQKDNRVIRAIRAKKRKVE
jgi:hypothetical protein